MQHLVTGLEPARIEGGSGAGLQRTSRADQPAFEIQESDYRKSGIDKSGPIEGAELASARRRALRVAFFRTSDCDSNFDAERP